MAKKEKNYLAVFAKGTPQAMTLPVTGTTKKQAKENFSRLYLGRYSSALMDLVRVYEQEEGEQ